MSDQIESDVMFRGLVQYLSSTAMFQLGKFANPVSGQVEKNLEGAKIFIDMLESVEAKTKGSLSDEEEKELQGALTSLRLNYIDEVKKEQEAGKESVDPEPAPEEVEGEKGATAGD
jgi:hypothetical protein